jgi:TRAP-type C4-dicarboxylate transport system permease small subunit
VNSPAKLSSLLDASFRALEAVLVGILAVMVLIVFGNVVLRYGFGSGITVTEELSRLLFVWLIFIGAIPVMRQHGHLGVEFLVGALPPQGQRICRIVSDVTMFGCCVVFGWGAWEQTQLNIANHMPISGLPTALAYGAAALSALGLGMLILADLIVTISSRAADLPPPSAGYEP